VVLVVLVVVLVAVLVAVLSVVFVVVLTLCLLCLVVIDSIKTFGFDHVSDEGTTRSSQELLGCFVRGGLSLLLFVILVSFHGREGSSASDEFMRQLGLVGLVARRRVIVVGHRVWSCSVGVVVVLKEEFR